MKKLSVVLTILFLVLSAMPLVAFAVSGDGQVQLPKAEQQTVKDAITSGTTEDPVTNGGKLASYGSCLAWSVPNEGFKLFGVFQYQDSQDYIGTTRYNQRDNPYNSAYPYNEAIFS